MGNWEKLMKKLHLLLEPTIKWSIQKEWTGMVRILVKIMYMEIAEKRARANWEKHRGTMYDEIIKNTKYENGKN